MFKFREEVSSLMESIFDQTPFEKLSILDFFSYQINGQVFETHLKNFQQSFMFSLHFGIAVIHFKETLELL